MAALFFESRWLSSLELMAPVWPSNLQIEPCMCQHDPRDPGEDSPRVHVQIVFPSFEKNIAHSDYQAASGTASNTKVTNSASSCSSGVNPGFLLPQP